MHFEDFCHHIREMIQVYILWMLHYMLVKICFAMGTPSVKGGIGDGCATREPSVFPKDESNVAKAK